MSLKNQGLDLPFGKKDQIIRVKQANGFRPHPNGGSMSGVGGFIGFIGFVEFIGLGVCDGFGVMGLER